jgi:hypothetical protein
MPLCDAYGRPFLKQEIEAMSKRAIMLPAQDLFSNVARRNDEYAQDFSPFVVASDSGFDKDRNEEQADWSSGTMASSPYSNLNQRFAHKNPISELNVPRDTRGLMTLSLQHAQENYIVSRAIRVKRNFALRDLQFLGSSTTTDFYKSEYKRLRIRKILSYAFRYYWTTGRAVVYWGEERPLKRLALLDPRFIMVRRILGEDKVFLLPDPRWKAILEAGDNFASSTQAPEAYFLKKYLPRYWIKYIKQSQPIPLKDNTYALIENDLELFAMRGIDAPSNIPLQPVFQNLAVLDMMMAGDFSVAWMMKHMIALVSIGDPKAEGQSYTRPDQTELQKLEATFQRPDYSIWAYVDPTVDVRWIAPDPALFNDNKYRHHVEAVEYCMGVPPVFSRGDGNFAASSMSIKPFREEIEFARTDMEEQLFAKLFPIMREGYTARKSGNKDPEISFDLDCLKDDRVLMDELTGKYDRGGVSVKSLLNGKAESYDVEVQRKMDELKLMKENDGIFEPAYDPSHGTMDEGGRPNSGAAPTAESHLGQAPRPSRAT